MKYQPEGCKVLVRPDKTEEVTKGGIVLPPQSREAEDSRIIQGEIVAIGPSVDLLFEKDRKAKVGDRVVFARYGGFILMDSENGQEYRILNDEDIVCWIKE